MEEFLTFGMIPSDPWRRVCCIREPVLLMVEFCQIQGPRPLFWHPEETESAHLFEEVAVWLMSSENLHGNFCAHFNQQLGLHVLIQYATMLDITARAFQRPFALALLMPVQPKAREIERFQRVCANMLLPLLSCNRHYVHSILCQCERLLEQSEATNFQSYYSTAGNAQQIVILSNKIKSIVQQTRGWYAKLMERVYGEGANNAGPKCLCACDKEEFRKFAQLLAQKQSSCQLVELMDMAPCAGKKFDEALKSAYYERLADKEVAKGLMFCGGLAVIRSISGANSELQKEMLSEEERATEQNMPYLVSAREQTLKSLSFRLLRCVYPLLIGEKVHILASCQRIYTGIDLLHKLNALKVCKRPEKVEWDFSNSHADEEVHSRQLFGVSCERDSALALSELVAAATKLEQYVCIDLNNHRMRTREYMGKLLAQLAGKREFPSDTAVLAFVAATIADIHQLVLLARSITPEAVVHHLDLAPADQLILYNLLVEFNLTRYTQLEKKRRELVQNMPYKMMKF